MIFVVFLIANILNLMSITKAFIWNKIFKNLTKFGNFRCCQVDHFCQAGYEAKFCQGLKNIGLLESFEDLLKV